MGMAKDDVDEKVENPVKVSPLASLKAKLGGLREKLAGVSKKKLLVMGGIGAVVVIAIIGAAVFFMLRGHSTAPANKEEAPASEATSETHGEATESEDLSQQKVQYLSVGSIVV